MEKQIGQQVHKLIPTYPNISERQLGLTDKTKIAAAIVYANNLLVIMLYYPDYLSSSTLLM